MNFCFLAGFAAACNETYISQIWSWETSYEQVCWTKQRNAAGRSAILGLWWTLHPLKERLNNETESTWVLGTESLHLSCATYLWTPLWETEICVIQSVFFFSFWMSKKDSHGRTWKRSWQVVFCKNYTWISKWFWEGCTEINLLFNSIFRKLLGVCWLSLWGGGIYSLVWTGSSPLLNSLNFSRRGLELVSVACWEPQLLDVASRACGGPTWVSAGNQESWLHRPCLSWGGSAVIL